MLAQEGDMARKLENRAKAVAQERSRPELQQRFEVTASNHGFGIAGRIGSSGGKRRKLAANYANPQDPTEIRAGCGRKPPWLAAKLKRGA
jgi:hypothetical protein